MKKIIANLKMNYTLDEIKTYEQRLREIDTTGVQLIVCPSFPFLYLFNGTNYELGAQSLSPFIEGAYTGEVSAKQLASLNVSYVIINHSERKKVCLNDDNLILDQVKNALDHSLKVILCLGETLEEKKKNQTEMVIKEFIQKILAKINKDDLPKILIAYEPEWAIGTGEVPSNLEIENVLNLIKQEVSKYGVEISVLYGGSISGYNISVLRKIASCDGFLIGKASLDIHELDSICQINKEDY